MKFSTKLKALVVAIGAATASQMSFASILHANPSTNNGSFLFVAGDDNGSSYIQSLTNVNGNFRLESANPPSFQPFTLDTSYAAFIAAAVNPQWTVIAADSNPALVFGGPGAGTYKGFRFDVALPAVQDASAFSSTRNQNIKGGAVAVQNFVVNADAALPGLVAGAGVYDVGTPSANDEANFFSSSKKVGFNILGTMPYGAIPVGINATLNAWLLEASSNTATALVTPTLLGQWKLNGSKLTYNAQPSAVPVPAAVWLLGSALAGVAGRRRRA